VKRKRNTKVTVVTYGGRRGFILLIIQQACLAARLRRTRDGQACGVSPRSVGTRHYGRTRYDLGHVTSSETRRRTVYYHKKKYVRQTRVYRIAVERAFEYVVMLRIMNVFERKTHIFAALCFLLLFWPLIIKNQISMSVSRTTNGVPYYYCRNPPKQSQTYLDFGLSTTG